MDKSTHFFQRQKETNISVLLELSAALWYNVANNLIRCGGFFRTHVHQVRIFKRLICGEVVNDALL